MRKAGRGVIDPLPAFFQAIDWCTRSPPPRASERGGLRPLPGGDHHGDPNQEDKKNAAKIATLISSIPCRAGSPRSPSLELSVLPNGGGQNPSRCGCTPSHWNSASYRGGRNHVVNWLHRELAGLVPAYGAEGNRTPDLCSAIAALSQLSYSPSLECAPRADSRTALAPNERAPHRAGAVVQLL
jgi:hypothetical protein